MAVDPFDTSGGDRAVEAPRTMLKFIEFLYRKSAPTAALFFQPATIELLVRDRLHCFGGCCFILSAFFTF